MKIKFNQQEKYIGNLKDFYKIAHFHDSIILSFKKKFFELEVDTHEQENCNLLLKFSNPKDFYIKKEYSRNLFLDNKELIGLKLNDCILDFNLIKFNDQIYFTILLNEYMHSLLFKLILQKLSNYNISHRLLS